MEGTERGREWEKFGLRIEPSMPFRRPLCSKAKREKTLVSKDRRAGC